jgi:hypothetical protein
VHVFESVHGRDHDSLHNLIRPRRFFLTTSVPVRSFRVLALDRGAVRVPLVRMGLSYFGSRSKLEFKPRLCFCSHFHVSLWLNSDSGAESVLMVGIGGVGCLIGAPGPHLPHSCTMALLLILLLLRLSIILHVLSLPLLTMVHTSPNLPFSQVVTACCVCLGKSTLGAWWIVSTE